MDRAVGQRSSPPSLKILCVVAIRNKKYSNKYLVMQLKTILESRKIRPIVTNPVLERLREAMHEVMLRDMGAVKRLVIANAWPPLPFDGQ